MELLSEQSTQQPRGGGKRKLDPGIETVLIGFKGSKHLALALKQAAAMLGLSYSEFLRAGAEDLVKKAQKLKGMQ